MKNKNKTVPQQRYTVVQITRADAIKKLQEQPELRRKNPNVSHAYGLYDTYRNGQMTAVVTFGSPPSPAICRGLCGDDEKLNILELNSLWADTSVSNDAVIHFLQDAMGRLPKEIILSYVPTGNERISRVYKQLGFVYTGLTKERTNRVTPEGEVKHNRSKGYDKASTHLAPRPRKHRFVKFTQRQDELLDKLQYDVFNY